MAGDGDRSHTCGDRRPRRPRCGAGGRRGHSRGPARVLAPAGAGKTKTLVSRVAELVERGADPAGILLLAFNRKAAEQLEERLATLGIPTTRRIGCPRDESRRVRRRDGDLAAGVHCATFNAFGYRYQREVMGARFTVDLDGAGLRALMQRAMQDCGASVSALKPARGTDPVATFLGALPRVRAALEDPAALEIGLDRSGDPHGHGAVRADPRSLPPRAAGGRPPVVRRPGLLRRRGHGGRPRPPALLQDRYSHLLVDEFQDLNGAQLALVDVLSRPRRELFAVGDDDQLIYGWRHADPRGILEFHRRMPPATVVGHVHAGHQLPVLARGGRGRRPAGRQQRRARGQGRAAARGRRRGRGALRRRRGVAGARRRCISSSSAPRSRASTAPGATWPSSAATARSSCSSRWHLTTPASRGRPRWAADCSRTRRPACFTPTSPW